MDCFECDNKGYLEDVLNTKDNVIETQRCDNCLLTQTDFCNIIADILNDPQPLKDEIIEYFKIRESGVE